MLAPTEQPASCKGPITTLERPVTVQVPPLPAESVPRGLLLSPRVTHAKLRAVDAQPTASGTTRAGATFDVGPLLTEAMRVLERTSARDHNGAESGGTSGSSELRAWLALRPFEGNEEEELRVISASGAAALDLKT